MLSEAGICRKLTKEKFCVLGTNFWGTACPGGLEVGGPIVNGDEIFGDSMWVTGCPRIKWAWDQGHRSRITLCYITTANNCIVREKGLCAIETKYVTTYVVLENQEHFFCQINYWLTPGHMYCKHQCNGYASERVA